MRKKTKKTIGKIILIFLVFVFFAGFIVYKQVFSVISGIDKPVYVYIDDKKNYEDLLACLQSDAKIKNIRVFEKLAAVMKYPANMKSGRYEIKSGMSYPELIRMFKNGNQAPVKLTFNNIRLKKDFVERVGEQMMFESGQLLSALNNPEICERFGFDTTTITGMFIPNTYEIYWTLSVDNFLQRMKKEYDRFWTNQRLEKAQAIPLTPVEVSVLASIVEEETAEKSEYPVVAGLYINRLRKGMLLQADPTVKFAIGDITLRRILYAHLTVDSPYNTYKYPGLPPGPVRIPSISGIDAVLNYAEHNYLYMVAKEDFSGKHNFSTNLSEHNRNARKYQDALNRNHIR